MTFRSRPASRTSSRSLGWSRVAAAILVPLLALLVLQLRYNAPHHVEDVNLVAAAAEQPLAACTGAPPISIAPPEPSAERPAGAGSLIVDARPLCPSSGRAPPVGSL
jgi:hypothetical protein